MLSELALVLAVGALAGLAWRACGAGAVGERRADAGGGRPYPPLQKAPGGTAAHSEGPAALARNADRNIAVTASTSGPAAPQ